MQHVDAVRKNGHEREKYITFASENVVTEVEEEIGVAEVDETSTGGHHGVTHGHHLHSIETADSLLREEIHGCPATTIVTLEELIVVPHLLLDVHFLAHRLADIIAHR